MRITGRLALFLVCVGWLTARPASAGDASWLPPDGIRCRLIPIEDPLPGVPTLFVLVCQIGEDGEPVTGVRLPFLSTMDTSENLDHIVLDLFWVGHLQQFAPPPPCDVVATPPTP